VHAAVDPSPRGNFGEIPIEAGANDLDVVTCDGRFLGMKFEGARQPPLWLPQAQHRSGPARQPSRPALCWPELGSALVEEASFIREVLEAAGLDFTCYRPEPMIRRIPACLRALRVDSLEAARLLIKGDRERLARTLNSLLIGTSAFFRDAEVFQSLRRRVIPELLRGGEKPAVWSVACSEGQELYSIAMLLAEREALGGGLVGTDCRPAAVERARAARYPALAAVGIPEDLQARFTLKDEAFCQIADSLREAATWRVSDAFDVPPSAEWDLILCRNLAIYLDSASSSRLWPRLVAALKPGGFLIAGKAERPEVAGLVRHSRCIYQKEPAYAPV